MALCYSHLYGTFASAVILVVPVVIWPEGPSFVITYSLLILTSGLLLMFYVLYGIDAFFCCEVCVLHSGKYTSLETEFIWLIILGSIG